MFFLNCLSGSCWIVSFEIMRPFHKFAKCTLKTQFILNEEVELSFNSYMLVEISDYYRSKHTELAF